MRRQPSIRALAATLALAAVLAALPSTGGAATRKPLPTSTAFLAPTAAADPFRDSLLKTSPAKLSRVAEQAPKSPFALAGGYSVLAGSNFYGDSRVQAVIDSLGALRHGREMNSLSVYVATRQEIGQICGAGTAACYSPSKDTMVISGDDESVGPYPRAFVIAHEYGHHIANHSTNSPWPALAQGTKRWSTYERVCEGVRMGTLHPGDEGPHYWENPGEAFAQAYATLQFPALQLPWSYTPLLAPDALSLKKIEADLIRPLARPRTITWRGGIPRRRSGGIERSFRTPLDGDVRVRLVGPRNADFDLLAIDSQGRRIGGRATAGGRVERLRFSVCGTEALRIAVRRRSGFGPFAVSVSRP